MADWRYQPRPISWKAPPPKDPRQAFLQAQVARWTQPTSPTGFGNAPYQTGWVPNNSSVGGLRIGDADSPSVLGLADIPWKAVSAPVIGNIAGRVSPEARRRIAELQAQGMNRGPASAQVASDVLAKLPNIQTRIPVRGGRLSIPLGTVVRMATDPLNAIPMGPARPLIGQAAKEVSLGAKAYTQMAKQAAPVVGRAIQDVAETGRPGFQPQMGFAAGKVPKKLTLADKVAFEKDVANWKAYDPPARAQNRADMVQEIMKADEEASQYSSLSQQAKADLQSHPLAQYVLEQRPINGKKHVIGGVQSLAAQTQRNTTLLSMFPSGELPETVTVAQAKILKQTGGKPLPLGVVDKNGRVPTALLMDELAAHFGWTEKQLADELRNAAKIRASIESHASDSISSMSYVEDLKNQLSALNKADGKPANYGLKGAMPPQAESPSIPMASPAPTGPVAVGQAGFGIGESPVQSGMFENLHGQGQIGALANKDAMLADVQRQREITKGQQVMPMSIANPAVLTPEAKALADQYNIPVRQPGSMPTLAEANGMVKAPEPMPAPPVKRIGSVGGIRVEVNPKRLVSPDLPGFDRSASTQAMYDSNTHAIYVKDVASATKVNLLHEWAHSKTSPLVTNEQFISDLAGTIGESPRTQWPSSLPGRGYGPQGERVTEDYLAWIQGNLTNTKEAAVFSKYTNKVKLPSIPKLVPEAPKATSVPQPVLGEKNITNARPEIAAPETPPVPQTQTAPAGIPPEPPKPPTATGATSIPPPVPPGPPMQTAVQAVPPVNDAFERALAKVKVIFPENRALLPQQKMIYHKLRRQVAGKIGDIRQTESGVGALNQSLAAAKTGEMPRVNFSSETPKLTTEELGALVDKARMSPEWQHYDFTGFSEALRQMQETNNIMTNGDLRAWERLLGLKQGSFRDTKMWRYAMDALGVPKTLTTMLDISAPMRQGAFMIGDQSGAWFKAWGPMLKAVASEDVAVAVDKAIRNSPHFELSQSFPINHQLAITERATANLSRHEEAFMSNLIMKIPGIGHIARASERAYVTFLNKLRMDAFSYAVSKWQKMGLSETEVYTRAEAWADAVNKMTGRGNIGDVGRSSDAMAVLNANFFSPRFVVSRVETPLLLLKGNPEARKLVARNLAIFVGGGSTALGLAYLAGAKVELDLRSTDFGKIRVGDTRLDVWAGEQQMVRYATQFIRAQRRSASGQTAAVNRADIGIRFVESKLSPAAGLIDALIRGRNFIGEPMTPDIGTVSRESYSRLVPMFIQDIADAFKQEGLLGVGLATTGATGVSVQSYEAPFNEWMAKYPELIRLGVPFGVVGKSVSLQPGLSIEWTPDERVLLQRMTGQMSEQAVRAYMLSGQYMTANDTQRTAQIMSLMNDTRAKARASLLKLLPQSQLTDRVQKAIQDKGGKPQSAAPTLYDRVLVSLSPEVLDGVQRTRAMEQTNPRKATALLYQNPHVVAARKQLALAQLAERGG